MEINTFFEGVFPYLESYLPYYQSVLSGFLIQLSTHDIETPSWFALICLLYDLKWIAYESKSTRSLYVVTVPLGGTELD